jgi:hypothetical protein
MPIEGFTSPVPFADNTKLLPQYFVIYYNNNHKEADCFIFTPCSNLINPLKSLGRFDSVNTLAHTQFEVIDTQLFFVGRAYSGARLNFAAPPLMQSRAHPGAVNHAKTRNAAGEVRLWNGEHLSHLVCADVALAIRGPRRNGSRWWCAHGYSPVPALLQPDEVWR